MASSSSSSETTRTIKLIAYDGEVFLVDEAVAQMAVTIKATMEDDCDFDDGIPIPNVTGPVLAKVIEYCKKHVGDDPKASSPLATKPDDADLAAEKEAEKAMAAWDKDFATIPWRELCNLLLAANFLNIKGLLDLLCRSAADHIKDFTPEQVREHFNIENDYTPEEEAAVRGEHPWAHEGI